MFEAIKSEFTTIKNTEMTSGSFAFWAFVLLIAALTADSYIAPISDALASMLLFLEVFLIGIFGWAFKKTTIVLGWIILAIFSTASLNQIDLNKPLSDEAIKKLSVEEKEKIKDGLMCSSRQVGGAGPDGNISIWGWEKSEWIDIGDKPYTANIVLAFKKCFEAERVARDEAQKNSEQKSKLEQQIKSAAH